MKTKEKLNALKEEVETVSRKLHGLTDEEKLLRRELTDEELETVTGGWSQNADSTYNIYAGDVFQRGNYVYTVAETKLNATLDTSIICEYGLLLNGHLKDWGKSRYRVSHLLGIK